MLLPCCPGYQVVLDAGGDRQASRAAADPCQAHGTPLIHSEILGATALVWTMLPLGDLKASPHRQHPADALAAAFASIAVGAVLRLLLGEPSELGEQVLIFGFLAAVSSTSAAARATCC